MAHQEVKFDIEFSGVIGAREFIDEDGYGTFTSYEVNSWEEYHVMIAGVRVALADLPDELKKELLYLAECAAAYDKWSNNDDEGWDGKGGYGEEVA